MSQPCTLCYCRDQTAVRRAFSDGLSNRAIGRLFGLSHVQVGYHRKRHVLEPLAAAVELHDRDITQLQRPEEQLANIEAADPVAVADTRTAFSREAQLDKVAMDEMAFVRLSDKAERGGLIGLAIQARDKHLKAIEVGSKLAQIGGCKQPHIPPQSDERGRWSITMLFRNSGKTEEIRLAETPDRRAAEQPMVRPVGARSRLEIDVPQVPQEVDGTSLRSCDAITPEVHEGLTERLVHQSVPDEQTED